MTRNTFGYIAGILTCLALYALMRLVCAGLCALAPILYPNIF